ncbi:hypothetical protein [Geofilum rubicundum]|uniref:Lipoprotein n=1 Tax=Geofilum rubicundum JCM 15548 TaxID=1236989 RepID=A0A0E9LR89_9BACT|nr:hypothetical protein [Geofilum rubicundum]GAO27661.1 hypothetical protein JCM15548_14502 [Geofilum rubicundum JCM 15548]
MKTYKSIYLLFLIFMPGCINPAKTSIDYSQMDDILLSSLEFSGAFSEPIKLYDHFYNEGTSHENQVAYLSFDEPLNYLISKRTIRYLSSRTNKPLTKDLIKSLTKNLTITLTKDTIVSNNSLLLISEPFSVSYNIFSFTITKKSEGIEPQNEFWIYYISEDPNNQNHYQTISVYDWQKDMLYKVEKLNGNSATQTRANH